MNTTPPLRLGVIASVFERFPLEFGQALTASKKAHAREIRLDAIREHVSEVAGLIELTQTKQPTILTLRTKQDGGREEMTLEEQYLFWKTLPECLQQMIHNHTVPVYVDFNFNLVKWLELQRKLPPFDWLKIGVSQHSFDYTPNPLDMILRILETTPAKAFVKIVTMALIEDDLERIKSLFIGRTDSRPLIAFAMGKLGEQSRRDCGSWGSAGTFGYIDGYASAAPGQLSINELLNDPSVRKAFTEKYV